MSVTPNPSLQPGCYGLRPSHAAELKRVELRQCPKSQFRHKQRICVAARFSIKQPFRIHLFV
jgi:hypothetical protein